MTWTTLYSTTGAGALNGRGKIVLWLRLAGIPYVMSTENIEPPTTDLWYWDGVGNRLFAGIKPWWKFGGMTIEEKVNFVDGTCEVQGFPVELVDVRGELTALVKSWRARTMTRLVQSLEIGDVHAHVDTPDSFPAAGTIWVGLEAMSYTGVTAGSPGQFTGLTRGIYGSIETDHIVDTAAWPVPTMPAVLDGPQVLAGRRADVYASTVDQSGEVSTSECIYRGYVGPDITAGQGVLKFDVEHITKLWSRKIGAQLPQTGIKPGYYYSGVGFPSWISILEQDMSVTPPTYIRCELFIAEGWYRSPDELKSQLCSQLATEQTTAGITRQVNIYTGPHGNWYLAVGPGANYFVTVHSQAGGPLEALGFADGRADFQFLPSANTEAIEADDPALFICEIPEPGVSPTNPHIHVYDAHGFEAGQYATIGDSMALNLRTVATDYVDIDMWGADWRFTTHLSRPKYIRVDNESDLVLKQCISFNSHIYFAIQRLFGIAGSLPKGWIVEGMRAGDIDVTGLSEMAPDKLGKFKDYVRDPTTISDLICDRLGVLGIAPHIVAGGAIGFAQLVTPTADEAETVEVDDDIWELMNARAVMTQVEGEPLLNQIKLVHSYDYRTGDWAPEARLNYDDGRSVMGKTRTKVYNLRGISVRSGVYVESADYPSETELILDVANHAIGAHFGIYGRVSPVVEIPCTWVSRQFESGDIVKVTHPCIVDTSQGEVGVTQRLGIIVGRTHHVSSDGVDRLLVQFPPETTAGRIAPAAYAPTFTPATKTLNIPTTNLYARLGIGETDLTYFAKDMVVLLVEYGKEAPATWGPSIIDSVGADSIVLDADPFGGAFPATGVVVIYADYDSCIAVQQARWLFLGDAAYTLGAAADEAKMCAG